MLTAQNLRRKKFIDSNLGCNHCHAAHLDLALGKIAMNRNNLALSEILYAPFRSVVPCADAIYFCAKFTGFGLVPYSQIQNQMCNIALFCVKDGGVNNHARDKNFVHSHTFLSFKNQIHERDLLSCAVIAPLFQYNFIHRLPFKNVLNNMSPSHLTKIERGFVRVLLELFR